MENRFENKDFERFVRQNADQYRMFPSVKVWKGIHHALHTRRRWYGIGLALLLLTTAAVTWVMLMPGGKNENLAATKSENQTNKPEVSKPSVASSVLLGPSKPRENKSSILSTASAIQQKLFGADLTGSGEPLAGPTDGNLTLMDRQPVLLSPSAFQAEPNTRTVPSRANLIAGTKTKNEAVPASMIQNNGTDPETNRPAESNAVAANKEVKENRNLLLPPYTVESVVNSYSRAKTKNRIQWMFYLTPTISYRQLEENAQFIAAARYNSIVSPGTGNPVDYNFDVNSVVDHKPDLGLQLGLRAAFPVSKWFSFTGGLQLSVSKYDIRAYNHSPEVATIALSTAGGGTHTVSAISNYRNTGGSNENWLRNFYFSASLPVGAELKLSDGQRNYFGVAGTFQPTYVLDNRAYLISTDYKNYAQVPSLTRHWNFNTSFEVFAAATVHHTEFRIGPQVRYQALSSFVKNYPIKEHLFDFGLKMGVRLNKTQH